MEHIECSFPRNSVFSGDLITVNVCRDICVTLNVSGVTMWKGLTVIYSVTGDQGDGRLSGGHWSRLGLFDVSKISGSGPSSPSC